jgi:hypothetical protein
MKKKMSYLFKAGVAFAVLFASVMCISYTKDSGEPTVTKIFTLDEPGTLGVTTSGGKIKVEGHDGNKVEVNAFIRKRGKLLPPSDPYLDKIHEDFDFSIEKTGSSVSAVAKRKEGSIGWKGISISFEVMIPHQVECNLKTSGGSISLSDVVGQQNAYTSGGKIKLAGIKGNVEAKTSGGGIHVSEQKGNISLNTSGGAITVEEVTGNMKAHTSGGRITVKEANGDISGHTSGGPISLESISGDAVEVNTSGGGIHITGEAAYVKATTSGGGIDINITGLSKELYLKTSGGGINAVIPGGLGLDLDLKASGIDIDLQDFSGTAKKGRIEGTLNGGGIPVLMHTSDGHIDLIFQ